MSATPDGLENENFVKVLRDVARVTVKKEQRVALATAADRLSKALLDLYSKPTPAAMQAANGAWSHAQRIFHLVDDIPDGGGPVQAIAA